LSPCRGKRGVKLTTHLQCRVPRSRKRKSVHPLPIHLHVAELGEAQRQLCLYPYTCKLGRAAAQAVSRRLTTATARVRTQVWACGICSGQSGSGVGFLRVLYFGSPCQSLHRLLYTHHYPSPSGAGTIGRSTEWSVSRLTALNTLCSYQLSVQLFTVRLFTKRL
jgi:hypothetical protein